MSDNSQLTAYLLGELSPVESAALEAQLAASPELQQELDALRQTVAALQSAFAQHVDIQPAVPAIDREKLHALLRSATGMADRNVSPTVSAPALLVAAPSRPARGVNSRGWLVAGAVLVVGGLVGLSQWESRRGLGSGSSVAQNDRGGRLENKYFGTTQTHETLGLQTESEEVLAQESRQLNRSISPSTVTDGTVAMAVRSKERLARSESELQSESLMLTELAKESMPGEGLANVDALVVENGTLASPTHQVTGTTTLARRPLGFWKAAPGAAPMKAYSYYTHQGPSNFYFNQSASTNAGFAGRGESPRFGARLFLSEAWDSGVDEFGLSAFGRTNGGGQERGLQSLSEGEPLGDDRFGDLASLYVLPSYEVTGNGVMDFDDDGLASNLQQKDDILSFDVAPMAEGFDIAESVEAAGAQPARRYFGTTSNRYREKVRDSLIDGEQARQAELPALTVTDYENGLAQLGAAVRGWGEFHQRWGLQQADALARGTQVTEAKESAIELYDEVADLEKLVAEQTRELQELREKTPEIAGRPLSEANPEAAKEAELALVRVSRELNRQQRVWYYREGYVRQLEATIAAAEQYAHVPENDFVTPEAQPLSTFGIDVDTASYSNVRRFVEAGQLPPPDAVRIEELINSFQYEGPKVEGDAPLAIAAEVSACPWQPQHQLLRVALKGKSIDLQQRPPARLVFLVDTSGSMSDENKLPLVKQSLRILVDQMREQDRLSIVTYSDNAGLLLDSTGGDKREAILAAIEGLTADGSTNGEAGLKLAYEVAVKQFGEGATNRVMLCTDGDFNVGESADSELVKLIEKQRQTGVFLNIFGFGSGNLKDAKLEAIADKGNGQYIYIDGIKEARKTLLNELTGTLYTIAKDVKLQIEFNPNLVGSYRLVGYENRAMAAKDFSNDKVDSGDMGAGHSVVALYEIVPPGAPQPVVPQPEVEPLKYKRAVGQTILSVPPQATAATEHPAAPASPLTPSSSPGGRGEPEGKDPEVAQPTVETPAPAAEKPADPLATELCTIRVRYKQPTSNESTKIETAVHHPLLLRGTNAPTSRDHIWATAVAQFGLLTRHSTFVGTGNYSQVLELALSAIGDDPTGQRREFVTLVRQTQSLSFERERQLAEISRRAEEHRRVIEEIKTVEKAPDVMTKASCSGKYKTLLRRIEVADDQPTYGDLKDFGRWEGAEYKTHKNLPSGYWVYVAPHWYIWGESTEQAAVDTTK